MRLAGAVVVALLLAASGARAASGPAVVSTAFNKQLKTTILVNAKGLTLYIWTADTGGQSVCVNDPTYHCSKHWIPLRTTGDPTSKGSAKAALLGTITRDDGTTQVTYKGHPLYTWIGIAPDPGDKKPGQVNGQCYLSTWWVIAPSGKLIKKGC
jgi:predicted lipoprotein with Yx(FWY)xxD motif